MKDFDRTKVEIILESELGISKNGVLRVMSGLDSSEFDLCTSDIQTMVELIKQAELITMDSYTANHERSFKMIVADNYEYLAEEAYKDETEMVARLLEGVHRVMIHESDFSELLSKLKFY